MRPCQTWRRGDGSGTKSSPAWDRSRRREVSSCSLLGVSTKVSHIEVELINRDHAIWFINNRIIDGVALREWMGSVDETIVAKHSARMGLVSRVISVLTSSRSARPGSWISTSIWAQSCRISSATAIPSPMVVLSQGRRS